MRNKRLISIVLAGCIVLGGAVTIHTFSQEETGVLFSHSFSLGDAEYNKVFFADFDTADFTGTYKGGKETVIDNDYGNSYKMTNGNAVFYAENLADAEATAVSFDLYCTNNTSRGVVELFDPVDVGTTSFETDNLHRTLYIREDKWIANFNKFNSEGGGRGVKYDYSANTWYHFDIWVDYELGTVKYYMDKNFIGEAALMDGFNAVGGMRYTFSDRGTGGVHYIDNVSIVDFIKRGQIKDFKNIEAVPDEITSGVAFGFDESKNKLGYIFDGNEPEFCVDLLNGTDEKQKIKLNLDIIDEVGVAEDSISNIYEIEPHSVKEVKIKMKTNKFGFHTLNSEMFVSGSHPVFSKEIIFSTVNMPKGITKNSKIGICAGLANGSDGYGGLELQRMARIVSKAGIGNVRTGVGLEHMSLTTLDNEHKNFADYTPKYGLDALFILTTVDKCLPVTDAEKEKWRQYVIDVVNEFGHMTDKYEVWNEFNVSAFNKNGASNSEYVEILKITKEIIDELDPDALVYGGVAANVETNGGYDHNTIDFIKDIFENLEGYKYMDGISVHTYLDGMPERSIKEFASTPKDKLIFELREWLDETGYSDVPVISSEVGFAGSDEERCSEWIARYLLMHTENLDEVYLYRLNNLRFNQREHGDYAVQNSFGLIREDINISSSPYPAYSAKPAFLAVCNYNAQLADAEFVSKDINNDRLWYKFNAPDGDEVHAVWMRQGSDSVTIDLNGKIAEVYDIYGNITDTAEAGEESVTVEVSTTPVYVRLKNAEKFYVYSDVSSSRVWVKGRTAPNEQVSVMLADNNGKIPVIYGAQQAISNSNGTYSICLNAGDSSTWDNYILRVGFEGSAQTQEIEYNLPVPKLLVTSDEQVVKTLTELQDGDSVKAVLSGVTGDATTEVMLTIVAYDNEGRIKSLETTDSELFVADTIEDIKNISKIKVMAWHKDTLCPVLASYVIE